MSLRNAAQEVSTPCQLIESTGRGLAKGVRELLKGDQKMKQQEQKRPQKVNAPNQQKGQNQKREQSSQNPQKQQSGNRAPLTNEDEE